MTRKPEIQSENVQKPEYMHRMPETQSENMQNETLENLVDFVSENKLLIGGLAAATGAAIYLFSTESGKRLRTEFQDRVLDAYDVISEQVSKGLERLNEITQDIMQSQQNVEQQRSGDIRKVA